MSPLSAAKACAYWQRVAAAVARGERALLVAENAEGVLGWCSCSSNSRRISLIAPTCRNAWCIAAHGAKGQAPHCCVAAEDLGRECGKSLLVLDTAGSDALRLYARLGWREVGVIPGYALLPDGGLCDTHYFYRTLR